MKVRILKNCNIKGVPAKVGDVVDVPEARAKALTDNHYAQAVETEKPAAEEAEPQPKTRTAK